MVIHLSLRFSTMLCLIIFLHFFISFKYDFHVDAERMIVKTRELRRWFKKNNSEMDSIGSIGLG